MDIAIALGVVLATGWLVCRAAAWLPLYYAREEQTWISAVRNSNGDRLQHPESPGVALLWREFLGGLPPLNRYTAIAILGMGLVTVGLWFSLPPGWAMAAWFFYVSGLILLALIDYQTKLLPDVLTIPLLWLGLIMQLFPDTASIGLEVAVVGAVLGYVPLWLLAQAYRLIRGRDGLGMGDLKLLAAMGAWSGPLILPQVLFVAALLAIIGFFARRILCAHGATMRDEFPFGPWLILAYLVIVFIPAIPIIR